MKNLLRQVALLAIVSLLTVRAGAQGPVGANSIILHDPVSGFNLTIQPSTTMASNQVFTFPSVTTYTPGSVLFANATGQISQNNANFFWNDGTHALSITGALGAASGAFTGAVSGSTGTFTTSLAAPTFTGNVTGNVSGSAASFTGSLAGDVTGTQGATTVALVGGVTAANVATGANKANAATNGNSPSTLVMRDLTGGFLAGTVGVTTLATGNITGAGLGTGTTASNKFADHYTVDGATTGVGTATITINNSKILGASSVVVATIVSSANVVAGIRTAVPASGTLTITSVGATNWTAGDVINYIIVNP